MTKRSIWFAVASVQGLGLALAGPIVVTGGPTFNASTGNGYGAAVVRSGFAQSVNANGVSTATVREIIGNQLRTRTLGVRLMPDGSNRLLAPEVGQAPGRTSTVRIIGNNAIYGTSGGAPNGSTIDTTYSAVWTPGIDAPERQGMLPPSPNAPSRLNVAAVNDNGVGAGSSSLFFYDPVFRIYVDSGDRAVRWDNGYATQLGTLSTGLNSYARTYAYGVNNSRTVVGEASNGTSSASYGSRPVYWLASNNAAVELSVLSTTSTNYAVGRAQFIAGDNTIFGTNAIYVNDSSIGDRLVRWAAGSVVPTQLGNLGTDANGAVDAQIMSVNDTGDAFGYSSISSNGQSLGTRAVRWRAAQTQATPLPTLGTSSAGITHAVAHAINRFDVIVGESESYDNGTFQGKHAVAWIDGQAVDVSGFAVTNRNSELGTWTLNSIQSIADNGWATGIGTYDPDASGPIGSYGRVWTAQLGFGGTWIGAASRSNWNTPSNWSTGTLPLHLAGNYNAARATTLDFTRDEHAAGLRVSAGKLTLALANFSLTSDTPISIESGAALEAGRGRIVGYLENAGTLDVSDTLSVQGSLANTGTLRFSIASPTQYDRIVLSEQFEAGGVIALELLNGYRPAGFRRFDLIDFAQLTGDSVIFDVSNAVLPAGYYWDFEDFANRGVVSISLERSHDFATASVMPLGNGLYRVSVPEPGSMIVAPLVGTLLLHRRRRSTARSCK